MTLIRGPKILNSEFSLPIAKSLLGDIKDQNLWLFGCLLVFVSTLCWSFSLIIQVNFTKQERSLLSSFFGNVSCFTKKLNIVYNNTLGSNICLLPRPPLFISVDVFIQHDTMCNRHFLPRERPKRLDSPFLLRVSDVSLRCKHINNSVDFFLYIL